MDHLEEAKMHARQAESVRAELMQAYAQLATAYAQIAQVEASRALVALVERLLERLPPPAETWSEIYARLREEDLDGV